LAVVDYFAATGQHVLTYRLQPSLQLLLDTFVDRLSAGFAGIFLSVLQFELALELAFMLLEIDLSVSLNFLDIQLVTSRIAALSDLYKAFEVTKCDTFAELSTDLEHFYRLLSVQKLQDCISDRHTTH